MQRGGASVVLGDLNDFINPSAACINPLFASASSKETEKGVAKISLDSGIFSGISEGSVRPDLIKSTHKKTAKVSLNDCLACSGCVTSAETVLISLQSGKEFMDSLKGKEYKLYVITIDPSARASLAAHFDCSVYTAHKKMTSLFKLLGVNYVFDSSVGNDIALIESKNEFISHYHKSRSINKDVNVTSWKRPKTSVAISSTRIVYPEEDTMESAAYLVASVEAQIQAAREASSSPPPLPSISKIKDEGEATLPLLASSCPGWICYAEKTCSEVLPYIATTKSPQAIMGSIVKQFLSSNLEIKPHEIYHATIMPCFDKKLEASRKDFLQEIYNTREVDCVLTPGEIIELMEEQSIEWDSLKESDIDGLEMLYNGINEKGQVLGPLRENSGSGGYAEYIFRNAAKELFGVNIEGPLTYQQGRNPDMKEVSLEVEGKKVLTFALAYGFRNIQTILRKIKINKCAYDYVEIMACPSGCLNGGGQIKPVDTHVAKALTNVVSELYHDLRVRDPNENFVVKEIYRELNAKSGKFHCDSEKALFHTSYHAVPMFDNPLIMKW